MITLTEDIHDSSREEDVRSMVRLAGSVANLPPDHILRKRHLMTGLCELVGAASWAWALGRQTTPGSQTVYSVFEQGGFGQEEFARYLTALEHPDMARMNRSFSLELTTRQSHLTRSRERLDPDDHLPSSPLLSLWQEAGLGPEIHSLRPLGDGALSVVTLFRKHGRPPFTPKEIQITHILLTECGWLHEQGWPEDRAASIPKLYPRQRMVLNLLLQGCSRQIIAEHLGISINTVSGYVKAVYRHFDVKSHAGLMRRFQLQGGSSS
jgi:DNA-binding CsgD family transcriptional regulator